ncbi:exported hypothetical protein [uncultured Desulfatiglans sp.]|uniref:Lipoprotein n=1 Tax=Uncultured Desulfatiglans sp. TaxID=1748965 RepID=A0A653A7I5_UNCDX|nr:exported hypothetical protein [uncultured Desulfatiglans sp.]
MQRQRSILLLTIMIVSVAAACAGIRPAEQPPDRSPLREKGYRVELGIVKAADELETPPSIPTRLRFELEKQLMTAGLRPSEGQGEKRLRLDVETRATYQGFAARSGIAANYAYSALFSRVVLVDPTDESVLAETVVKTFNGFGSWTADMTEIDHAAEIVRYVASIDPS